MESSRFWQTDGTGDGPSDGYTMEEFYDFIRKLLITDQGATEGVLIGVDNELAVSGAATPLSVASGAAIVYGFFYENTSPLSLAVTTPVVGTTGGRVILRADWTAQTVRAVILLNTDGVATLPALTQTPGSVWEISLATFTITIAGAITLTDARVWAHYATEITLDMIRDSAGLSVLGRASNTAGIIADIIAAADYQVLRRNGNTVGFGTVATAGIADDAVTQDKIADNAVGTDQLADDAVTTGKILNDAVTTDKIANNAVTENKINTGAVTSGKIAADSVDDTKVGNRVPQMYRRQGGNAANWNTAGVTTYTPGMVRIQAGAVELTFAAADNVSGTVTFPVAFGDIPLVLLQIETNTAKNFMAVVTDASVSDFDLTAYCDESHTGAINVNWVAIGTE